MKSFIAAFRAERLGKILGAEVEAPPPPYVVLHLIPLESASGSSTPVNLTTFELHYDMLQIIGGGISSYRYTADGFRTS